MSVRDTWLLDFYAQLWQRQGIEVEYGSVGFPGELWISYTNNDHRWNVWSAWEINVPEDPCGPILEARGYHWWCGRWVRTS